MKNIATTVLLLLATSYNLHAQYSIKDDDHTLNKKEMAQLELVISKQIVFFQQIVPDTIINFKDVRLNIFTDYGAYLLYQKEQMNKTLYRSMGFYSSKNKEAVVCKDKNEKRFLGVCYHELSHFFTHTYLPLIPIWINEGMAVYFGDAQIRGKNIKPQMNSSYTSRVKTMIDTRDIDLKDFMQWSSAQFQKKSFTHNSYGYALGYTMFYFLMKKSEDLAIKFIQQVIAKQNCVEAFDAVYDGGFEQFEKDYFDYIIKS